MILSLYYVFFIAVWWVPIIILAKLHIYCVFGKESWDIPQIILCIFQAPQIYIQKNPLPESKATNQKTEKTGYVISKQKWVFSLINLKIMCVYV